MASYTITIAPNDNNGSHTTLIVDSSGDQVRITDVRLHADDGLTSGQMPTIDFGLLLKAVTASTDRRPLESASATAAPTPGRQARTSGVNDKPAPAPDVEDGTATGSPLVTASALKRHPAKRTADAASKAPAAVSDARGVSKAGGSTTAPAKRASRRSAVAAGAVADTTTAANRSSGRAYRRMPRDFAEVYQQASTADAIADHYAVPKHTAQGWIRTLKKNTNAGH